MARRRSRHEAGTITHWIDGKAWDGPVERWGDVYDPATGESHAAGGLRRPPAVVDEAVAAATRGRRRLARGLARHAHARPVRVPRARRARTSTSSRELLTREHGKVAADALGEVNRGLEVVEFACGLAAAPEGRVLRERLDRRRQLLDPPAARRRGRHHAVQLPGHGADVDVPDRHRLRQHLRPQAVREGPVGRDLLRPAAGRGRAARRRLQRGPRRQGRGRRDPRAPRHRGGELRRARRRSRATSTRPARAAASACRPSAARRTTWWCCPTPTWTWPPTPR